MQFSGDLSLQHGMLWSGGAVYDLNELLAGSGLRATAVEKVNFPRLWKLVICEKPS